MNISFQKHCSSFFRLNSKVVSASLGVGVGGRRRQELLRPVQVRLRHLRTANSSSSSSSSSSHRCVYWDLERLAWSGRGCVVVEEEEEEDASTTVCRCGHLAAFAVVSEDDGGAAGGGGGGGGGGVGAKFLGGFLDR